MARPGLTTHRKFRRLARVLGSAITARGCLELLWDSCYESGDEYVGTAEDLEALVGWAGGTGALAQALVEAGAPESEHGFIEIIDRTAEIPTYRIHDLWHHAPEYVSKRRKREMERQLKVAPQISSHAAPNGGQQPPSSDWQNGGARTPAPSPAPSPAPNRKNGSAATSATPAPRGSMTSRKPVCLVFPTVGPVSEWPLSEAQVAEWASLFGGLDVRGEARKALAWIGANPRHRKTAQGMKTFLVRWLTRAVDDGRGARFDVVSARESAPTWSMDRCPHEPVCGNALICERNTALNEARRRAGQPLLVPERAAS